MIITNKLTEQEARGCMLDAEDILKQDEGHIVNGLCVLQSFSICPQKNGGRFAAGTLQSQGAIPFKAWGNSPAFAPLSDGADEYKNRIVWITGSISKYGGVTAVILDNISLANDVEDALTPLDFMKDVYDADDILKQIRGLLSARCSEGIPELFDEIAAPVMDRLKSEFAAVSHHDNVKGGLIAHTLKVMKISDVIGMYPGLLDKVSADAIYLGCALHDIGKIFEYENGSVSGIGKKLSHHTLGVRFLLKNEKEITEKTSPEFFDILLSIIEQHHGEFEERPRTVAAYLVHKFDVLESALTSLATAISSATDDQIAYDGFKLSF